MDYTHAVFLTVTTPFDETYQCVALVRANDVDEAAGLAVEAHPAYEVYHVETLAEPAPYTNGVVDLAWFPLPKLSTLR